MELGELFITLGFHADTIKLKEFMHAVGELNMSSIAGAVGLGSLYEATRKIMNIADQSAMSIWGFSQTTGISQKQTQQFSGVVEDLGGSADEAKSSLDGLQKAMLAVQLGNGNAKPFVLLGLNPGEKDPFVILTKLQDFLKFSNVKDSFKQMIVAELGMSQGLIPILKNIENLAQAMDKVRIAEEQQILTMVRFHQVNAKMGRELKLIWIDLATIFEPAIETIEHLITLIIELMDNVFGMKKSLAGSVGTGINEFVNWLLPFAPKDMAAKIGDSIFKPFETYSGMPIEGTSWATKNLVPSSASGNTVVNHNFDISVSGVQDPEKASELVTKKLEKLFSDRFYHEKVQER